MRALLLLCLIAWACAHRFNVQLKDEAPEVFALRHGVRYVTSVAGFAVFESDTLHPQALMSAMAEDPGVLALHKDAKKSQYTRAKFDIYSRSATDPLYSSQWHLHAPNSMNVEADRAWNELHLTGKGIAIAIVDDGLQHTHPDLAPNYDAAHSYDYNGRDADPEPTSEDAHGTSAAGVAAAARSNGVCGCGAAPEATLVGLRLIAAPVYDSVEAQALTHAPQSVRIYSCSWGPYDGGDALVAPGPVMQSALKQTSARGGVIVWAGGNGRAQRDNGNYDGYANSPYTLTIGAITDDAQQAWYSEDCACLMGVTPSNGGSHGITTTDLVGEAGYSSGLCTSTFGGTSSAAPLAAGVVALMLEARPQLTGRDVQHVVARAATKIQIQDPDWSAANARGYRHSHRYGFGLLRAVALIEEAKRHALVPAQKEVASVVTRVERPVSDTRWDEVRVVIPESLNFVEHVLLKTEWSHAAHGQVQFELRSGQTHTTSVLAGARNDRHAGRVQWTFSSARHWGESHPANGSWVVRVRDGARDSLGGTLHSVQVVLLGY